MSKLDERIDSDSEEQQKRTKENSDIVGYVCERLWEHLQKETDGFSESRRYVIFSRVTAFMVANVYMPIVERAVNDAILSVDKTS